MPGNQYEVLRCAGPTFTASSAVSQVAVTLGAAASFQGPTPPTAQWFDAGDGLLFKSLQAQLPHSFGQGTGEHTVDIRFEDSLGGLHLIPELSPGPGGSLIFIPTLCDALTFPPDGLFVKVPTGLPGTGRVRLKLVDAVLNVSQVNLPAILNGVSFQVSYFLQILHAPEMGLVP